MTSRSKRQGYAKPRKSEHRKKIQKQDAIFLHELMLGNGMLQINSLTHPEHLLSPTSADLGRTFHTWSAP
jgi:hypothetical protein